MSSHYHKRINQLIKESEMLSAAVQMYHELGKMNLERQRLIVEEVNFLVSMEKEERNG